MIKLSLVTLSLPAVKKLTEELYKLILKPIALKIHPDAKTTEAEKQINWKKFLSHLIRFLIMLVMLFILWKLIVKIFPNLGSKK